jgi:hypothetical protein
MDFMMIRMGTRMRDFMMGVGIHMLGSGYRLFFRFGGCGILMMLFVFLACLNGVLGALGCLCSWHMIV